MANVLPLMPFLNPGALADQATIENARAQMGAPWVPGSLQRRPQTFEGLQVGPTTGVAGIQAPRDYRPPNIFSFGLPPNPILQAPGQLVSDSIEHPARQGALLAEGPTQRPPGQQRNFNGSMPLMGIGPGREPIDGRSWIAPDEQQPVGGPTDLVSEEFQQPPLNGQFGEGVAGQDAQERPGYSYKPPQNYQPSASDFYPNGEQQQPQQQGGMSDAGMWGLLAAGLGILANNYGNYGNASPALGKGGLIGLETFLGQRQQNTQNQLRRDTFNAELQGREEQRAINSRLAKVQEDKDKRAADADLRRQKALERFKPANDAEALLLELAPDEFAKLKLKQGENTKLGQGEGLYDANGKLIVKNPKEQDVPSGMRMVDGKLEWIPGYLDGKKQVAAAGASKITVGPQAKAFTGPIADQVDAAFTRIKDAVSTQNALNRLEENLDDPKLITGFGAKARLTAAQVAQLFGGDGADLAVTRSTIQGFAEIALQSRGMLKGQGQVTENEQKLLDRARSGDISFTLPELKELVSVLGRANKARYDDDAETIGRMEGMQDTEEAKKFYKPKEWPKKDLKKKYGLE
jgi:hypothetical protein